MPLIIIYQWIMKHEKGKIAKKKNIEDREWTKLSYT